MSVIACRSGKTSVSRHSNSELTANESKWPADELRSSSAIN